MGRADAHHHEGRCFQLPQSCKSPESRRVFGEPYGFWHCAVWQDSNEERFSCLDTPHRKLETNTFSVTASVLKLLIRLILILLMAHCKFSRKVVPSRNTGGYCYDPLLAWDSPSHTFCSCGSEDYSGPRQFRWIGALPAFLGSDRFLIP